MGKKTAEQKLRRLSTFIQGAFKSKSKNSEATKDKAVENPMQFFEKEQELEKYALKYNAVYDVKEIGDLFYAFLKEEYNTPPYEFILEYDALEEDYPDTTNVKLFKKIWNSYYDENSPTELNISAKIKKEVVKKVEETGQLTSSKWVIDTSLKQLFFKTAKLMKTDLGADNFPRFVESDAWKEAQVKYHGNDEVMEKLQIYDIEESKDKNWDRKGDAKEEELGEEQKLELAKKHLAEGLDHFKNKEWEKAYDSFTQAIEFNNKLKEAYFNRGVLNYNAKKYVDAISDMLYVVEMDPTNAKALSIRGMSLKITGKYEMAAVDLGKALEHEEIPNNYMLIGICYDAIDELEKAIDAYTNYIEKTKLKPTDSKELFKVNMMSVLHNRAQNYFQLNQYQKSIDDYTKSIGLCDHDDFVREMKGKRSKCYTALNMYEEAKIDYIESMQNNVNEIYNEAIKLFYAKKYVEALDTVNAAIEIKDDDFNFYYVRGVCSKTMGDPNSAIVDFETCLKLNPDHTKAMFPLAKLYVKKEKFKSALKYYGILIEKEPTPELYLDRGVILSELEGSEEKAVSDFTNAIKLNENFMDAYENRGILLKQMEEFEKAIPDFTKLLTRSTVDPDMYVERGMCYYELDEEDKAVADFKKALEIDPENERAQDLLEQLTEEDDEE
eukprot:gene9512-1719_t